MLHEGGFHLEDIQHLQNDEALRTVMDIEKFPSATTMGDWLRRIGQHPQIIDAWVETNQLLLQSS